MDTYNPLMEKRNEIRYRNMTDEEFCAALLIEGSSTLELEAHKRIETLLGERDANSG